MRTRYKERKRYWIEKYMYILFEICHIYEGIVPIIGFRVLIKYRHCGNKYSMVTVSFTIQVIFKKWSYHVNALGKSYEPILSSYVLKSGGNLIFTAVFGSQWRRKTNPFKLVDVIVEGFSVISSSEKNGWFYTSSHVNICVASRDVQFQVQLLSSLPSKSTGCPTCSNYYLWLQGTTKNNLFSHLHFCKCETTLVDQLWMSFCRLQTFIHFRVRKWNNICIHGAEIYNVFIKW